MFVWGSARPNLDKGEGKGGDLHALHVVLHASSSTFHAYASMLANHALIFW